MRYQQTDYYRGLPDWKRALVDNPDAFVLKYFGHRIEKLEDFHVELLNVVTTLVRALALFPAGHGKTTLGSTIVPILHVCRNPNVRVGLIGKNEPEIEGIMRVIQSELTDNHELIRDFGPFKPPDDTKAWALGRLDVAQRTRRGKESTITAFGSSAKTVLGYRTDVTICDDVVTQDNSATATQRERIRNWFDLCVETGPEFEDSQLIVIGTRFDPSDLYGDLIEMIDPETGMSPWKILHKDAIADEDTRQPLWPDQWSWKRLMQKKASIGTLSFNKRYRNLAVDESSILVREQWVRGGFDRGKTYKGCLDRGHAVGDRDESWRVICGFDPASGAARKAKFCAHITLGLGSCKEHERCLWVIDLHRDQMTLPQQVDLILQQHQEHDARISVIEANSYQVGLYQAVQQRMDDQGLALTVEPHYTSRVNKPDPDRGVEAMSPWFENGWVHIPWQNAYSQRKMSQLVDELCLYAGRDSTRTTDTVMAFWFSWLKLQLDRPVYNPFNRLVGAPKRPWAPRQGRFVANPYYVVNDPVREEVA